MMTFWIGAMIGCVVGVGTVCFMAVAAEEDRWLEKHNASNASNTLESLEMRCKFCGSKLSEVRTFGDKKYRHCYSCHFDFEELP